MTMEDVRAMLPKVGDHLQLVPTARVPFEEDHPRLHDCTVVEVNRAHAWFRVRFDASGIMECYALPAQAPKTSEDYKRLNAERDRARYQCKKRRKEYDERRAKA